MRDGYAAIFFCAAERVRRGRRFLKMLACHRPPHKQSVEKTQNSDAADIAPEPLLIPVHY